MQQQQEAEIRRLLECEARKSDALTTLGLDIETCEFAEVARRYRKATVLVHPDKCKLPKAPDAFRVLERAYKMIPSEAILERLKLAHARKKESDAKKAREAASAAANKTSGGGVVDEANLSKEERIERMRQARREDELREMARVADEAAKKKARLEKKKEEDELLGKVLAEQIAEAQGFTLF